MKRYIWLFMFIFSIPACEAASQAASIKVECKVNREVQIAFSPNKRGMFFDGIKVSSFDAQKNTNKNIFFKDIGGRIVVYTRWSNAFNPLK